MDKENKSRHGCLTALLVVMLIANSASAAMNFFAKDLILESIPGTPEWVLYALAAMSIFNVICVIGLLQLKMWAFYGFIISSIVALMINLFYIGLGTQSFMGLIGIALLYGTLQIGKDNKGWPQLD